MITTRVTVYINRPVDEVFAFVADPANANVQVDLYPSGTPFMTLGSSNGLSDPASAATNPQ